MKSFFIIRILIYMFFIIHIVLSINKIEVFPVFGWDLYPYTHPYMNLYRVKVVSENHKKAVSLHGYIGSNKYYINRTLRVLGTKLDRYKNDQNSTEFKKAKENLERYILRYVKTPLSYQLLKQRVNLPLYVLFKKKNSIVSKKIIVEGSL